MPDVHSLWSKEDVKTERKWSREETDPLEVLRMSQGRENRRKKNNKLKRRLVI